MRTPLRLYWTRPNRAAAGSSHADYETNPIPTPPACPTLHNGKGSTTPFHTDPSRNRSSRLRNKPDSNATGMHNVAQPANPGTRPIPLRNKPDSNATGMHNVAQPANPEPGPIRRRNKPDSNATCMHNLAQPANPGTRPIRRRNKPDSNATACPTLHNRPTREPGPSDYETNPIPMPRHAQLCPTGQPRTRPIRLPNKPDSNASIMPNLAQRKKRSMTPFHNHPAGTRTIRIRNKPDPNACAMHNDAQWKNVPSIRSSPVTHSF
jgi:hypothetical protein